MNNRNLTLNCIWSQDQSNRRRRRRRGGGGGGGGVWLLFVVGVEGKKEKKI